MDTGTVHTKVEKGIASLTFFHPQSNSLPGQLLNNLAGEISAAGKNPEVRVIVLKSQGDKAFCAGASFEELISIRNPEEGKKFFSGFASVINAMRKAPKFVIARIQGKAVGGGVGLASAADYAFALEGASVKLSELALGIGPFVIGPAVERKIGKSAFTQLAINPTLWQNAVWARDKGLYAEVFSKTEEMDAAIFTLASKLADSNPETISLLKKVLWEGTEDWDEILALRAEMSGKLVLSEYTRKAIDKFKSGT